MHDGKHRRVFVSELFDELSHLGRMREIIERLAEGFAALQYVGLDDGRLTEATLRK